MDIINSIAVLGGLCFSISACYTGIVGPLRNAAKSGLFSSLISQPDSIGLDRILKFSAELPSYIFGERIFSFRAFFVSLLISLISFAIFYLMANILSMFVGGNLLFMDLFTWNLTDRNVLQIIGFIIPIFILSDYISTIQTRILLRYASNDRRSHFIILLIFVDLLLSFLIYTISFVPIWYLALYLPNLIIDIPFQAFVVDFSLAAMSGGPAIYSYRFEPACASYIIFSWEILISHLIHFPTVFLSFPVNQFAFDVIYDIDALSSQGRYDNAADTLIFVLSSQLDRLFQMGSMRLPVTILIATNFTTSIWIYLYFLPLIVFTKIPLILTRFEKFLQTNYFVSSSGVVLINFACSMVFLISSIIILLR